MADSLPDFSLPLLADIALDVPGRDSYTYLVGPELADLQVGACVLVPFGLRRERGFVVSIARRAPPPGIVLKTIISRRDGVALPAHLMALIAWGARYYRCSIGEFLAAAVPAPVREGVTAVAQRFLTRVADFSGALTSRQRVVFDALGGDEVAWDYVLNRVKTTAKMLQGLISAGALTLREQRLVRNVSISHAGERHPPTAEQQRAIDAIDAARCAGTGGVFLLYGVTGSGKTLVYLELAERCIATGRQVLLLLPEIALTPQLASRLRARIPRTAVIHSAFSDGERSELWRQVVSGEIDLVVGTRSALFAPLPAPGLLIVDEEHESSYKQESTPRYHARDCAVVYAKQLGVPVVLGSATPCLESVHNGRSGRYQVLSLLKRPAGGSLPTSVAIDMRRECREQGRQAMVSRELLTRLGAIRGAGEQAIVFLNRRGWSPVISCRACGETVTCRSCAISLTWHRGVNRLRCHYCGHQEALPTSCPKCAQAQMSAHGIGTEQLADILAGEVPGLRVLRLDADTVNERQGHASILAAFAQGEADCLVGTQMVAKGLDFPRVTLVGIVGADRGLSVPDFRAGERTFQLVAQVSGRAGRGSKPGTVVVQAYDLEAPPIATALAHQPRRFYDAELELRQMYGYPPFAGLVRFLWSGEDPAKVQLVASEDGQRLQSLLGPGTLLGPNEASLSLLKGQYRWHALYKAPSRAAVQAFLDRIGTMPTRRGVRVAIDVDPQSIG